MARTYSTTRFVTFTIVTVKTTDDDFNVIETSFTADGLISEDEASKLANKKYGKAKLLGIVPMGNMYGLTTEEVAKYGHPLNPLTRQPWDDGLSNDEKAKIIVQYMNTYVLKNAEIVISEESEG